MTRREWHNFICSQQANASQDSRSGSERYLGTGAGRTEGGSNSCRASLAAQVQALGTTSLWASSQVDPCDARAEGWHHVLVCSEIGVALGVSTCAGQPFHSARRDDDVDSGHDGGEHDLEKSWQFDKGGAEVGLAAALCPDD